MLAGEQPFPTVTGEAYKCIAEKQQVYPPAPAMHDNLPLAVFELLTHSDITYRQSIAESLGKYLCAIAGDRDVERLRRLGKAIELVIRHVEYDRPFDAMDLLVADYIVEAESRQEPLTVEALREFIRKRCPDHAEQEKAHYYHLLERLGRPIALADELNRIRENIRQDGEALVTREDVRLLCGKVEPDRQLDQLATIAQWERWLFEKRDDGCVRFYAAP